VEIWRIPVDHVAGIPAPLGISKVELADGRWVPGFICEAIGLEGAEENASAAQRNMARRPKNFSILGIFHSSRMSST
tara:strand:- start:974 stop:1204 length:231 start_codon:yes stop_codon:yes gene_type:complete